jgi:hypothetical protein
MNFILWLIGIGEAFFIIYLLSRYLLVMVQDRKSASLEKEPQAEVQRLAG